MLTFNDGKLWVVPRRALIRYGRMRANGNHTVTLADFGGSLVSDFVNLDEALRSGKIEEVMKRLEREFQR